MKPRLTLLALLATLIAAGCGGADGQRLAVKQAILDSAPPTGETQIHIVSISITGNTARARVRLASPQLGAAGIVPLTLRRTAGHWRIVSHPEITIIR